MIPFSMHGSSKEDLEKVNKRISPNHYLLGNASNIDTSTSKTARFNHSTLSTVLSSASDATESARSGTNSNHIKMSFNHRDTNNKGTERGEIENWSCKKRKWFGYVYVISYFCSKKSISNYPLWTILRNRCIYYRFLANNLIKKLYLSKLAVCFATSANVLSACPTTAGR